MTTNNNFSGPEHIQSPTWSAIDAYAIPHTHPTSRPNAAPLQQALEASQAAGLPDISASPAQAKFLSLLCRAARVSRALEVGTLGGYTAIWLTTQNPGLRLTTVEVDAHHAAVARENMARAGVTDRVEVLEGKGVEVLPRLRAEIDEGKRERFGLVFIDADKPNNWNYFDIAVGGLVGSGAIVCVDNVVRKGKLADADSTDPRVVASRELVEKAGRDPRVDSVVVQTVDEKGYDGCLWAVVN